MTLDFIFPALPPALDGIGDYTARLASTLAPEHDVRILTAQPDAVAPEGVAVDRVFSSASRRSVYDLVAPIARRQPDWVSLQYNPFSYGEYGLNLHLPGVVRRIQAACPSTRIALTVHEPFVPAQSLRFAAMSTWQRWQLWRLGRRADVLFFAIEPWAERFQTWFDPSKIVHLPVSSNMPRVDADRDAVRSALGFTEDTLVVGLFGRGHPSRLLPFVRKTVDELRSAERDAQVLYVGPAVDVVAPALDGVPHVCTGALPGPDVSRHFAAMDLYLAPFRKGVSARRGSFLVGIQHGVATVTTTGVQTDSLFYEHDASAFLLAPDDDTDAFEAHALRLVNDPDLRRRIAAGGQALFDDVFAWPRVADAMMDALGVPSAALTPSTSLQPLAVSR